MADADPPINLNKWRKARARSAARQRADANAVRFGRTKAEKIAAKAVEEARAQRLEAHKRRPGDNADDPEA